jgi:hypothetical protein
MTVKYAKILKAAEKRRDGVLRRLRRLPTSAKTSAAHKTILSLVGPAYIASAAEKREAVLASAEFMLSVLESLPL